ncbi:hypothetical protein KGM48_01780 [Patescibacteria group bacterium]|nr:hypothetical protein [Patescibacteria group bacterium]
METSDAFPQELVKELEARGAVPIARWKFLVSRGMIWFLAVASVVIGGIAFAIAEFVFFDNDGIAKLQGSSIQDIAQSIPFVWLGITAFFTVVAYCGLRRTRRGYTYATTTLVLVVVLFSISLGIILNHFDFGQRVYRHLPHRVSLQGVFTAPSDGAD